MQRIEGGEGDSDIPCICYAMMSASVLDVRASQVNGCPLGTSPITSTHNIVSLDLYYSDTVVKMAIILFPTFIMFF